MILLDLDDTLIDHSGAEATSAKEFGKKYCDRIPSYDRIGFPRIWKETSNKYIAPFLRQEITFQQQRQYRMRDIFQDTTLSDDECDTLFSYYLSLYEDSWCLFPDVLPFLKKNTGSVIGVLSDGAQRQQEMKLARTGIAQYVNFILTAESTGLSKPDPRFFQLGCKTGGCTPDMAYYIGDNLVKDAIGACKAGLNGIWLNRTGANISRECVNIQSLEDFTRIK